MSAEHHYLNAVEAYDENDAEKAYEEARKAVSLDPEHIDAWQICAETILPPKGEKPSLIQAAKSLAAVRKIIELDPNRTAQSTDLTPSLKKTWMAARAKLQRFTNCGIKLLLRQIFNQVSISSRGKNTTMDGALSNQRWAKALCRKVSCS